MQITDQNHGKKTCHTTKSNDFAALADQKKLMQILKKNIFITMVSHGYKWAKYT